MIPTPCFNGAQVHFKKQAQQPSLMAYMCTYTWQNDFSNLLSLSPSWVLIPAIAWMLVCVCVPVRVIVPMSMP